MPPPGAHQAPAWAQPSTDLPGDPTEGLPGDEGHGLGEQVRDQHRTEVATIQTAGHRAGHKDMSRGHNKTTRGAWQAVSVGFVQDRAIGFVRYPECVIPDTD